MSSSDSQFLGRPSLPERNWLLDQLRDETVGGILLSTQVDIRTIFLVAAVPPLIAATAYLAMGRSLDLAPETPED